MPTIWGFADTTFWISTMEITGKIMGETNSEPDGAHTRPGTIALRPYRAVSQRGAVTVDLPICSLAHGNLISPSETPVLLGRTTGTSRSFKINCQQLALLFSTIK
jgi:hypothetical protein